MKSGCYYCGSTDDTRPYGPGASQVCFPCVTSDPERDAAAVAVFVAQLEAAAAISPIVLLDEDGPNPA